jgi:hypothetical protein
VFGRWRPNGVGVARSPSRPPIPITTPLTCITRCVPSSCHHPNDCDLDWGVDDFVLTPAERALLTALDRHGVRFLLIGLAAALVEGAPVSTQDLDLWLERPDDEGVRQAASDAGGFWLPGFGLQPPGFGGAGLERVDVVLTAHGLDAFTVEYERALPRIIDGVQIRVLPLERIIASKRATNRPKDRAALPALEATLLARNQPD